MHLEFKKHLFGTGTRLVLFSALMVIAQVVQAGLLSFLGDVSSISSAFSSEEGGQSVPNYELKQNKQVQNALKIQGLYSGAIDGNLNSYASRKAISEFQEIANLEDKLNPGFILSLFGATGRFHKGVLDENSKQDLIYYNQLANEFDNNIFGAFQNQPQLEMLYEAAQDFENQVIDDEITKLSDSMEKALDQTTRKGQPVVKLNGLNDKGFVVDKANGFVWQDKNLSNRIMRSKDAKQYCKTLTLDGVNKWIRPWQTRLDNVSKQINAGQKPMQFKVQTPNKWIWSTNYQYAFDLKTGDRSWKKGKAVSVRCVYRYK